MKVRYGSTLTVIFISLLVLFVTHTALFSEAQPTQQGPPPRSETPQLAQPPSPFPLDQRIPHPACPHCFKLANGMPGIFEAVPGTDYVISRDLPDPAPLPPGEVWPDRHPETGEPLWYKDNQAFVGPTDEEPMSASLPVPLIQVKRVMYRHLDDLRKIEGVLGVGIGEKGIVVSLLPERRANRRLIPDALEGIPVYVEEEDGIPMLN